MKLYSRLRNGRYLWYLGVSHSAEVGYSIESSLIGCLYISHGILLYKPASVYHVSSTSMSYDLVRFCLPAGWFTEVCVFVILHLLPRYRSRVVVFGWVSVPLSLAGCVKVVWTSPEGFLSASLKMAELYLILFQRPLFAALVYWV